MENEKEFKAKIIADLMKIRSHLIPEYPLNNPMNNPVVNTNTTYCILSTIIAVLMDKYDVSDRDVRDILIEESRKAK